MKTYINFFKKVRSNFNNYMEQFRINLFKYESHEIIVGDRTSRYAGNNSTRDTIFLISSPDSMNAIDYTPTRFKCAVNAIDEYIRLRTKLSSGDRIGVVHFNNEARFIFHLMKPNELVLEWGEEFEPRGTIYMEKGFGGVNRILKRQKKFAEETFTVLITDSPEPVDGCMRCTD